MSYPRYFRTGQKVWLRPLSPAPAPGHVELLTSFLEDMNRDHFELRLPYGPEQGEQYPFTQGMTLELSSQSLGLGLKMTAEVTAIPAPDKLQLTLHHNLAGYQRRHAARIDVKIPLRFTRGQGNLKSMRATWIKYVELLKTRADFGGLEKFTLCEVNLSASGLRFPMRPPVAESDLCLVLMILPDDPRPICLLTEVVWVGRKPPEAPPVGLHYLCITEEDQQRLEAFIQQQAKD